MSDKIVRETAERVRTMLVALVVAAILLESIALAADIFGLLDRLVTRIISFVAVATLAALAWVYARYTRPATAIRLLFAVAMSLLLTHQFLRVTGAVESLNDIPVIGKHTSSHDYATRILEPIGLVCLLSGLFLTGAAIFRERRKMAIENERLSSRLKEMNSVVELEVNMRRMLESVHDIVTTFKPDGTILDINRTARGFDRQQTIGTSIYEYMPADQADIARRAVHQAREERKTVSYEIQALGDDGALVEYDCRVGPVLKGDEVVELVIMATDVTIQRRSREALTAIVKGTSAHLGSDFHHSLVKHLALALDVRYAFVGVLQDEQSPKISTLAVWNGGVHAENFEYDLSGSPCEDILGGGRCAHPRFVRKKYPDDQLLGDMNVEGYLGAPLRNPAGEAVGLLAVMHDAPIKDASISLSVLSIFAARAEAELERQRADEERHELQQQVQHVQKLESLGVLAGGIAHDFNNLLMGILGYTGLTRRDIPEDSPAREHLDEIERAAKRAAGLTNQMLSYSGHGKFASEIINIPDLIDEILHLVHASISKKAKLTLRFDPKTEPVEGDPSRLRQVFMNLITNASDALDDKSGEISVSTRHCGVEEVQSHLAPFADYELPQGRYICISVADTGTGMDDETQQKMFDPFFSSKFAGRGLGLAAVIGIVRSHNGAIAVDSAPGSGTVIHVYLPITTANTEAAQQLVLTPANPPGSDPPENHDHTGTILFADDESYIRVLARRVLESAGYGVVEAADGEEAVRLFENMHDKIDAVVLDLTMPGLGGEEVYERIRKVEPEVRVLLSSGYADKEAASLLARVGANGFLAKPYTVEALVEKVRELSRPPAPVDSV